MYVGLPPRPDGVYDLLVDRQLAAQAGVSGGATLTVDPATGTTRHSPGAPVTLRFDGLAPTVKDVEVWLPHDETTELVALRTDAPVSPSADCGRRPWVHHGSSITHGSNASHPTGTWPAVAGRMEVLIDEFTRESKSLLSSPPEDMYPHLVLPRRD